MIVYVNHAITQNLPRGGGASQVVPHQSLPIHPTMKGFYLIRSDLVSSFGNFARDFNFDKINSCLSLAPYTWEEASVTNFTCRSTA